jgi:hypothetical protein
VGSQTKHEILYHLHNQCYYYSDSNIRVVADFDMAHPDIVIEILEWPDWIIYRRTHKIITVLLKLESTASLLFRMRQFPQFVQFLL